VPAFGQALIVSSAGPWLVAQVIGASATGSLAGGAFGAQAAPAS